MAWSIMPEVEYLAPEMTIAMLFSLLTKGGASVFVTQCKHVRGNKSTMYYNELEWNVKNFFFDHEMKGGYLTHGLCFNWSQIDLNDG